MKRLVVVTGGYDLLNAISYMQSPHAPPAEDAALVLYSANNVPDALRDATQRMADAAAGMFSSFHFVETKDREQVYAQLRALARDGEIEVVTWRVFGRCEKYAIRKLAPRRLVLIENGISTYEPIEKAFETGWRRWFEKPHRRPDFAWLPLSHRLALPANVDPAKAAKPDPAAYRALCRTLAGKLVDQPIALPNKPVSLLVGTSYHRKPGVEEADERDVYVAYAREAASRGRALLWKPHPRSEGAEGWLDALGAQVVHTSLPLEVALAHVLGPQVEVASIASSALATCDIFFDAVPIPLGERIVEAATPRAPHAGVIHRLYAP